MINDSGLLREHSINLSYRYLQGIESLTSIQASVDIGFEWDLSRFATHKCSVHIEYGIVKAVDITLTYNAYLLWQCPQAFLSECIAHEIAHVAMDFKDALSGYTSKEHGHEWREQFSIFAPGRPPLPGGPKSFDDRAQRLFRGGLPGQCACKDYFGFHVIPCSQSSIEKLTEHELICRGCKDVIQQIPMSDIPSKVYRDLALIREMVSNKQ